MTKSEDDNYFAVVSLLKEVSEFVKKLEELEKGLNRLPKRIAEVIVESGVLDEDKKKKGIEKFGRN